MNVGQTLEENIEKVLDLAGQILEVCGLSQSLDLTWRQVAPNYRRKTQNLAQHQVKRAKRRTKSVIIETVAEAPKTFSISQELRRHSEQEERLRSIPGAERVKCNLNVSCPNAVSKHRFIVPCVDVQSESRSFAGAH